MMDVVKIETVASFDKSTHHHHNVHSTRTLSSGTIPHPVKYEQPTPTTKTKHQQHQQLASWTVTVPQCKNIINSLNYYGKMDKYTIIL